MTEEGQIKRLARTLLECQDTRCSLCAACLNQLRAILGLSDTGWSVARYEREGQLAARVQAKR